MILSAGIFPIETLCSGAAYMQMIGDTDFFKSQPGSNLGNLFYRYLIGCVITDRGIDMEIAPYIFYAHDSGLYFAVILRIAAEELLEEPVNPVCAYRREKHKGTEIVYRVQTFFPGQFHRPGR